MNKTAIRILSMKRLEAETKTLEQKLKFDFGFLVNKAYHAQFLKNGSKRDVIITIPAKGYPLVTIKTENDILESYQIIEDKMKYKGSNGRPYSIEQFNKLIKTKATEIRI